jgi:hypothetical protein
MSPAVLWERWVGWTHAPVDARALLWVRRLLPLAVAGDLLDMVWRGAWDAVLFPAAEGGLASDPAGWFLLDRLASPGPMLWWVLLLSMVVAMSGRGVRVALVIGLLASAQYGHFYTLGDRGIDRIIRTTMLILICSRVCDSPTPQTIRAWAPNLIRWLLVLVYLGAGIGKLSNTMAWWHPAMRPELYTILADPLAGRLDPMFWGQHATPFILGGWATLVFELSAPLIFTRFAPWWALVGMALHLGIAATMYLGMFPFGMLALYPLLFERWLFPSRR